MPPVSSASIRAAVATLAVKRRSGFIDALGPIQTAPVHGGDQSGLPTGRGRASSPTPGGGLAGLDCVSASGHIPAPSYPSRITLYSSRFIPRTIAIVVVSVRGGGSTTGGGGGSGAMILTTGGGGSGVFTVARSFSVIRRGAAAVAS